MHAVRSSLAGLLAIVLFLTLLPFSMPQPAAAQVTPGASFGSAVPCLSGDPAFATTCFADTILWTAPANDPALVRFSAAGQKQSLAPLGARSANPTNSPILNGIGSTYGVAYDDGAISGVKRIFAGAFTHRLTSFGSGGPGGIYAYRFDNDAWSLAATVPGAGANLRGANDPLDRQVLPHVGRSGLGDLEISPDGRTLYLVNVAARRIERYDISQPAIRRLSPLSIPWGLISPDPAVQADLVPFALEFYPNPLRTAGGPALVVGITDTAARGAASRPSVWPSAHVLTYFSGSNSWALSFSQDLVATAIRNRHQDTDVQTIWFEPANGDNQYLGWNPWRDDPQSMPARTAADGIRIVFYPQPLLTDIEFSRDGRQLWLGLRDRTGDLIFANAPLPGDVTGTAQGDLLSYRLVGSTWSLDTVSRLDPSNTNDPAAHRNAAASDYFNDNLHAYGVGGLPGHMENHIGSLATSLHGGAGGLNENLALSTLLGMGNSGIGFFTAGGGTRSGALQLISAANAAGGKSGALGDLELLCTYAFVRGRVWRDADGNGVQDPGESGFAGIVLELYQGDNAQAPALARATTDANGAYSFAVPANQPFNVRLAQSNFFAGGAAPSWTFSPANQGDDSRDSDIHSAYGYLEVQGTMLDGGRTGVSVPMLFREEERVYDIGLRQVVPSGFIGDLVWNDLNRNGIQDAGEPGLPGVQVRLDFLANESAAPQPSGTTYPRFLTSSANGHYLFAQLPAGVYRVTFTLPNGYTATQRDAGGDDARDSDVDAATGYAARVVLNDWPNNQVADVDFGVYGNSLDLSVGKSGPAEALVGANYSYTLAYALTGNTPAANVRVIDTLPAGVTFLSANPAPSSVSGNVLTWNLGTQNPGASGAITVNVRAPSTISGVAQNVVNQAQITTSTTVPADGNPANNTSTVTTRIARAEVRVQKTAPATALVGDEFAYTLTYSNNGGTTATNVDLRDTVPSGLTFVRFSANPGGACSYTVATRLVRCLFPSLAAGASGAVGFVVRAEPGAPANVANTATISTSTPGDTPGDNTSTTSTAIQFPNVGTSISITPAPWPVGTPATLRPTYRNTGTGLARSSVLTVRLPPGTYTVSSVPPGCTYASATRAVTCSLGDLPPGASGTRNISIALPPTFPADSFSATATISTTTPERPADQADNSATARVDVVRPNVWVQARGPDRIVAQGSVFWYVVDYGNLYRSVPGLTRAAENVQLRAVLPPDVTYQGVNGPQPSSVSGQTLTWNLGTLAPQAGGQVIIVVQTNVPAGAILDFEALISTSTPGDEPSDNRATVRTDVVQPPASIPEASGDLRLAIHSELDPNSQDGDPFNGVYLSDGTRIAWPTGEVLDFTPRLRELLMDGDPLPWPYEYRARVIGWSVTGFAVNGVRRDPQAGDDRSRAGCRSGAPVSDARLLVGCRYAYLGGEDLATIAAPPPLREDQLRNQAHVYWTQPPAPPMRDDVYLYTVDPLAPTRIHVQLELEISIVNAYPGAPIDDPSIPEIPIVPLPEPARRLIEATFDVELLVPRSVIGPGSVNR
jgi:uncharacterized repeat protein (TIGR01451 family)